MKSAYRIPFILFLLVFTLISSSLNAQSAKDSIRLGKELCMYAEKGNLDSLLSVIRRGANPNYCTPFGISPLMYATEGGHTDVVKTLLHNGADPDKQPRDGFSSLMHASYNADFDVAYALARYNAKLDLVDIYGASAMHYAVFSEAYEIVDMLIYYNGNVNIKAKDGNTPLHLAMYLRDTSYCSLLIHHGADMNIANRNGYTPLMLAAQENNIDVLKLLIDKGANVDHLSDASYSALSYAILYQRDTVFDFLINRTSPKVHSLKSSSNPINLSKQLQNKEYAQKLEDKGFETDWKPTLYGTFLSTTISFNKNEFYNRHELALWDYKYNLLFGLGFSHRYKRKSVLLEMQDDVFYQVFEKRIYLDLNLQKRFPLVREKGTMNNAGLFVANRFQFAMGKYVGLEQNFEKRFYLTPSLGIYALVDNLYISFAYTYTPYGYINISPSKYEISIGGLIPSIYHKEKYFPKWL